MNKNIGIIIGVVVVAIVAGGIYVSTKDKNDAMVAQKQIEQKAMEEKKMVEENAVMEQKAMEEKSEMSKKTETSMMKSGSYESYSPEKVLLASATHNVVLFFRASWCPTCRAVDSDIKANLSKIPETLAILDVNYDNSSDLKKKYGVTYQHTFVQVDKDGNQIKKWSGSPTLSAIVSEIK